MSSSQPLPERRHGQALKAVRGLTLVPEPDSDTGYRELECGSDPGTLGTDDAVHALNVHLSCETSCRPRACALAALADEHDAIHSTYRNPQARSHDEIDRRLAELVRLYLRLVEQIPRR